MSSKTIWGISLIVLVGVFFLSYQSRQIVGGDSGDLVTAAYLFGVAHPPGYPLYTFLGWLFSQLPLFSVAWRVGLLSVLPHLAVVLLTYLLVFELTAGVFPAVLAALFLATNYLFFLYSVTPEVFALFDLFVILLSLMLFKLLQTDKTKYFFWFCLILGLALSHHHVILFLFPGIAYLLLQQKKLKLVKAVSLFLLGLLPYLYLPLAGATKAIVNWDRPRDLAGFIQLVTRADYGTFVSGASYGNLLSQRLVALKAYLHFLQVDFQLWGIFLILSGGFFLWQQHRKFFGYLILAILFLGPGFFFYASFPLLNRFSLGTYERFLLPSYLLLTVLLGLGIHFWLCRIKKLLLVLLVILLSLNLVFRVKQITTRFAGFSTDYTADKLGQDLLTTTEPNSLLFVSRDTPLFTTQYVRYVLGYRSDVQVIHLGRFNSADYQALLKENFPLLQFNPGNKPTSFTDFLKLNLTKPIYSNLQITPPEKYFWVPAGLLFKLTAEVDLPTSDQLIKTNAKLWEQYQRLDQGILGNYNHLLLADIRDVYAASRVALGKTFLRAGELKLAQQQFVGAVELGGDTEMSESLFNLGLTQLAQDDCQAALNSFAKASEFVFADAKLPYYQAITYRDCLKDEKNAAKYFEAYQQKLEAAQTPLELK